ncbi:MAG: aminoacetone oxidase family FAD-binding enzyme [Verrucomicrobiota bacterium]
MPQNEDRIIAIAGAGPAGVYAAITAAQAGAQVVLIDSEETVLRQWRFGDPKPIDLTREIWDPIDQSESLVAGQKEMLGAYTRYGPGDFEAWLEENGESLEVNDDGLVTIRDGEPTAIAQFFDQVIQERGIQCLLGSALKAVDMKSTGGFWLTLADERTIQVDRLIIAGGGLIANPSCRIIEGLGHVVTECLPALTGFQCQDPRISGMAGPLDGERDLRIGDTDRVASRSISIEPWGISGPAAWELSSRHASRLEKLQGRFPLRVSWLPGGPRAAARLIDEQLRQFPQGRLGSLEHPDLPSRLWRNLVSAAKLELTRSWDSLEPPERSALVRELSACEFEVVKRKNVRSISSVIGGVASDEIDFRTMASRRVPGLYFAGSVLEPCAIAPADNLQIAWTTGWMAGQHAKED